MPKKSLAEKAKDWALVLTILMSGITGKVSYDNHGLSIEIERTKQALKEAEENNFGLAGVNCD